MDRTGVCTSSDALGRTARPFHIRYTNLMRVLIPAGEKQMTRKNADSPRRGAFAIQGNPDGPHHVHPLASATTAM